MAGAWIMNDDGEFVLSKEYERHLKSVKAMASQAWMATVYDYLARYTVYTQSQLNDSFLDRVQRTGCTPQEAVDGFIIEALEGNL